MTATNTTSTTTQGGGAAVSEVPNNEQRKRGNSAGSIGDVSFLSDDAHAVEITKRTPWCAFFGSMAFITLLINSFMSNFTSYMLLTQLPSILLSVLKFSPRMAGILSMPPFVALLVSNISFGTLFRYLQSHYHWRIHTVRLVAQSIALIGSAICLLIVVFVDNKATSYAFLIIAQIMLGAYSSGVGCGYTDISPNFSFSMNSIGNTVGSAAGLLGPIVIAEFTTKWPGIWGWRASFILTAACSVIATIFWLVFSISTPIHHLNIPVQRGEVGKRLYAEYWRFA